MHCIDMQWLKNRSDFIKCRKGTRAHERAFVLQAMKRDQDKSSVLRVGFTVTKKIGNAVVRNRIKRRFRAAIKCAHLPLESAGYDVVLIARHAALNMPFDGLIEDIKHGFDHALKIKNKHHIAKSAHTKHIHNTE